MTVGKIGVVFALVPWMAIGLVFIIQPG